MNKLKKIAKFYISDLITSDYYNSTTFCKDVNLLFPDFYKAIEMLVKKFQAVKPEQKILFNETFRSNKTQLMHYNNGASKIKTNGMHHYGIAVDILFEINGKRTYDGDYKLLRKLALTVNGLHLIGEWDKGHIQGVAVSEQQALRNEVINEIKLFQKKYGLVADGIVGKNTIAKAKEIYQGAKAL